MICKNLTVIVINFLREPYLYKCLDSLRKQYPKIKILVGENGEYTNEKKKIIEGKYKAKYIPIEFDAGICVARNKLVEQVDTDYFLIGDDDFFYTQSANVRGMLLFMENHPEFALVGGRIEEAGEIRNYQGFFDFVDDEVMGPGLVYKALTLDNYLQDGDGIRYKPCDLVFNFFVGRKSDIVSVGWDKNIKVSYEHSTFFIDLKRAGKKVAFTPDAIVIHRPKLDKEYKFQEYETYRRRRLDKRRFFERNAISWARDIKGNIDKL